MVGMLCAQVLLDVTSIAPDRILLLDSYFYVVVFHGSSIAQWRKDGYHLQPDHAHFKELLEVCLCSVTFKVMISGSFLLCHLEFHHFQVTVRPMADLLDWDHVELEFCKCTYCISRSMWRGNLFHMWPA